MIELQDVRWLFFDLGNTLIDERKAIQDRIQRMIRALAERGIQVSAQTVERAFKEAAAEFAPRLVVDAIARLASDPLDRAFVLQKAKYRKELEGPYPQARELLSRLVARFKIGVIANQSAGTAARLESYGLLSFISLCLSSTEVGLHKPDAAIFGLALEQARCPPGQAAMVGDRLDNDIGPAKALGWRTIRVLQGFARVQIPRSPEEEPDWTVGDLSELMAIA